jgi:molybdopterin/thiamine biosynthesis adenylyltransferase
MLCDAIERASARAPQESFGSGNSSARCTIAQTAADLAGALRRTERAAHASAHAQLFTLARCACTDELAAALEAARVRVELHDPIHTQLEELARIRSPREALSEAQLQRAVRALLGARSAAEYGVWAYFAWSRRLVHVLDEAEFVEVRTNRNLYKIAPSEHAALARKKVGVIGLSAGQGIALNLAAERACGELRIADFDSLSLSNLNRIRGGVHELGANKAILAAREIAQTDPYLKVVCTPQGVRAENMREFMLDGGKLDLLFEECDGIGIKLLAREHAREHGVPVVMATSDRGLVDVERFDLEPRRPILHGLVGDLRHEQVAGLSYEEKVPHALKIVGAELASTRLKASMLEIRHSALSWPQLAAEVALGAATAADIGRRMLLGAPVASGRYLFDLESTLRRAPCLEGDAPRQRTPARAPRTHWTRAQHEQLVRVLPSASCELLELDCVHELVRAGCAAPSGGNTQPWRWAYGQRTLLLLRNAWGESFLDYAGLGSCVAAGAAAQNVLLRTGELGLACNFVPFPAGEGHACVAAFSFCAGTQAPSHGEALLARRIFERHTQRKLQPRLAIGADALDALRAAASDIAEADLSFVTEESALAALARIIGEAQQWQIQHRPGHAQLVSELRWNEPHEIADGTGIPVDSLELTPLDRAGLEICREWDVIERNRAWGGGSGLQRLAQASVRCASALGLITVAAPRPRDFFAAGRALQRLWLAASARSAI